MKFISYQFHDMGKVLMPPIHRRNSGSERLNMVS